MEIINTEKARIIITEIFDLFGKHNLNQVEIEFIIDELNKINERVVRQDRKND